MNLAKLEAQIFLEEVIDALPDWQVDNPSSTARTTPCADQAQ